MANRIDTTKNDEALQLSIEEKNDIRHKTEFEIVNGHYKTLKLGAIANIIGGFFYVLSLYHQTNTFHLITWYILLVTASMTDILWAMRYQSPHITLEKLHEWRKVFLVIVAVLCLTWSSIGILFVSGSQEQIITLSFLLAVLICFGFSAVTDFTVASISIGCLLLPPIFYRIYIGTHTIITFGHDPAFNIGISLALLVLGFFVLITCYFGQTIVKKFFRLSFENMIYSQKLNNMNKILENRVKERTVELENSLAIVKFQASHDLLTSLPNHRSLLALMEQTIETANQSKKMFALACFSLNNIDKVNEGLGPKFRNIIVKRVAQRFNNLFEKQNNDNAIKYSITISRKDDFLILIESITHPEMISHYVEILFSILKEPLQVEEKIIKLTASIGVSIYPKDGKDINTLIMNAGSANLRASQHGGNNIEIYHSNNNADLLRQLDIESQLDNALKNHEFVLQYQPVIDAQSGKVSSAEALIRWESPTLGMLSPNEFIHLAEMNGMIVPIGLWVFKTACHELKKWHDHGFKDIKMAINLSYKQLQHKNIVTELKQIITQSNIDPRFIELELLERQAFLSDAIPVINNLKSLGISISIDDFGTGYSALSSLKFFLVDKIKIDKTFVQDIATNSDSRNIIINTISLAKGMHASVAAEGVETEHQFHFLQSHGCDMIQGYYFSPPLDSDAFLNLLNNPAALATKIHP